jgi:ribonuclease P protein component
LQAKQRYTLGKSERLKSRKAIDQLFATGKSFSAFPLKLFWHKSNNTESLQAAFSVSKRHFKKAVHRNRIKRLMREAWRLQKNGLCQKLQEKNESLTVFILFTGNELPEYEVVFSKMAFAIKRLEKIIQENPVN